MRLICNLLALLQLFFAHSQCGHVQEAKRHIHAELRNALGHGHAAGSIYAPPPHQVRLQHHYHHHHHHRQHGEHAFSSGSHGQRVHRLRLPHHQRWSGRRRSISHHQPFSRWTQWTPCGADCTRRRERYCKAKRRCGHTKHVEQRKCWHCEPPEPWHESSEKLHVHNYPPQQPLQQPSIVINAAAAAASGPTVTGQQQQQQQQQQQPQQPQQPQQATPAPVPATPAAPLTSAAPTTPPVTYAPPTQPPIYSPSPLHPHTEPPLEEFPPDSVEVVHRPPVYRPELIDSASEEVGIEDPLYPGDEGDFFVLKRRRRIKWQQQQAQRRRRPQTTTQRPKPSAHDDDYSISEDDTNEDDFLDFLDNFEQHSRRPRQQLRARSLSFDSHAGSSGVSSNPGPEGDVFQYEDFDMEPDNSQYLDSEEYVEGRNNSSWRNSPDGLQQRHRRLYSKWSRWTKCSPKCTTRRYKKCRISEQCGREVLREIAYCYTEGSFCQQWLQAQVQKTPAFDTRPGTGSAVNGLWGGGNSVMRRMQQPETAPFSSNAIDSNFIMSSKGYRGQEYAPPKLRCGLPGVRNGRRNMYNMLKIIGGKVARKGDWPWQVAIFNRFKEAFCGGTLIAPNWVLTAAHCVRKVLYVRMGEHNLEHDDGTEVQLRVLKSFKHPNFDKRTVDSDVALLRLPTPVNTTNWIGYSCLPHPYQPLPKNSDCTIIGWGKRRSRDVAGTIVLHQAEVPIIPMDNCRNVYHDYTITKNMFCAGHRRGRIDTCAGDSGGPLLCRDTTKPNHPWTIFGITSFGDGCAKRNKFGIYAKVPNYVDWVWSVVNCNGNCKLHQRAGGGSANIS